MAFFTPEFAASIAPKERGAGAYLNPSSIEDGSSVRFAILSESPLTGYEVWFTKADGGQTDRKSTRLNSSHEWISRMPSSA